MGRKFGVMITLVGFCIPLALFPFARGYNHRVGLLGSVPQMKLVLKERFEETTKQFKERTGKTGIGDYIIERVKVEEFAIPYKYPVAIGIVLIFIGIGFILLFKTK